MNGINEIYSRSKREIIIKGFITIFKNLIKWLQNLFRKKDDSVISIRNSKGLNITIKVKH